jgi:PHD/YefM family antitoxin component YafN of YafNO toxin-antitoxin module
MDPMTTKCLELLKEVEGKNVPLTVNNRTHRGVVFVYSGDNWEAFAEAIRQAVDKVQETLLERKSGKP